MKGIDLLVKKSYKEHLILPVDGAYEYDDSDLTDWDKNGTGTTFNKYYNKYYDTALKFGLNPAVKPTIQDITETKKQLEYDPKYSLMNVLQDLEKYGEKGPPIKFD